MRFLPPRCLALLGALAAFTALVISAPAGAQGDITVSDIGLNASFQGFLGGDFNRDRPNLAVDFNLDGKPDFLIGSLGDHTYVLENRSNAGRVSFKLVQVLLDGVEIWGGSSADYDNDGDYDLVLTNGFSINGGGFNYLFKNMFLEEGRVRFEDVTEEAGIKGPVPAGETEPVPVENANAVWGDYDRDGDDDLFVNVSFRRDKGRDPIGSEDCPPRGTGAGAAPEHQNAAPGAEYPEGRNILWRNNGDGTFTDVTDSVGLGVSQEPTRHSTWLDADNDGDLDLYENNFGGFNVLWKNLLIETGTARFADATDDFTPPGEDLSRPFFSFVSCSADFNQDGWEDLMVYQRGLGEDGVYPDGHAIFLNDDGTGFVNVAEQSGIHATFIHEDGVMGSMVGDLNTDGVPDIFVGNGGPGTDDGQINQLYLSDSAIGEAPHYVDRTDLIDFEAPKRGGIEYPTYPYRGHGTTFVDVNGDGTLEIAVGSGGFGLGTEEPNRLYKFAFEDASNWIKIRPVGDGDAVATDAIGTRFALTVRKSGQAPVTLYRTLFGGQCFSAHNGFTVHYYLGERDTIDNLKVTWPDGRVDTITTGLSINGSFVVERDGVGAPQVRRETLAE